MLARILVVFISLSTPGFAKSNDLKDQYAPNANRGFFGGGFYKPLNINTPAIVAPATTVAPGAATTTTTVAPAQTLTALDRASLNLINSFRNSHMAPEVTYNTSLAMIATQCAEAHARGNSLTTPACNCGANGAETCGISANEAPSQRARGAISDPSQLSWFSQYTNPTGPALSWPNPTYDASYSDFTQMIWVDTQMVGCGTSTTMATTLVTNPPIQAPQYVFCCCWVRAGNTPSTFAQNVLEDTV